MLKWLHSEENIITAKVCAESGTKKENWYKLIATAVATKPPDVIQQIIDFVREQPMLYGSLELARLCKGEAMIITLLHVRSLFDVLIKTRVRSYSYS